MINMNGWFLTIIILNVLGLGLNLGNHGKPREGNNNFWASLFGTLIVVFITYMAVKTGFH